MSVTIAISVEGLTVRAAFIAGLAVAALLLTGWRKPARAEPRSPRAGSTLPYGPLDIDPDDGVAVDHHPAPAYRRPGVVRRLVALAASGGIALIVGVLLAILLAYGVAFAVIWMTDLLQQ